MRCREEASACGATINEDITSQHTSAFWARATAGEAGLWQPPLTPISRSLHLSEDGKIRPQERQDLPTWASLAGGLLSKARALDQGFPGQRVQVKSPGEASAASCRLCDTAQAPASGLALMDAVHSTDCSPSGTCGCLALLLEQEGMSTARLGSAGLSPSPSGPPVRESSITSEKTGSLHLACRSSSSLQAHALSSYPQAPAPATLLTQQSSVQHHVLFTPALQVLVLGCSTLRSPSQGQGLPSQCVQPPPYS